MIDIHVVYGSTPTGGRYPLEKALASLTCWGADWGLLHSLKSAYYNGPGDESAGELLALCGRNPGLLPVAGLDLRSSFDPEETALRLKSAGFAGVRFFFGITGTSPDTPLFRRLIGAAEELRLPVFADAPAGTVLKALEPLGPLTLPIILLNQNPYDGYSVLGAMEERENLFLEIRGFNGPQVMEYLVSRVGDRRLLFGSRTPMDYLLPTKNMVDFSGLTQESKERILDRNARQLFHIPEGRGLL